MITSFPDLSRLKPPGGKRSSKREQIVSVFLRQEGHLSADDLFDQIRKEDQRISRALFEPQRICWLSRAPAASAC